MSAEGPPNPLGDRPRMAKALASLKEGLRDSGDPLYDTWKVRSGRANPASAAAPRANPEGAIDNTVDGAREPALIADPARPTPSIEASPSDACPTEEGLITDGMLMDAVAAASTVVVRASVQTDTVRVRVVRYQAFPRWALIVAAALLVFAVSLVTLRASLPRDSARSARSVLASEVPAVFMASSPAVATLPASSLPVEPAAAPLDPVVEPYSEGAAATEPPSPAVPPSAPTGRLPSAPPRRRAGAHDFFRDPGF